MSPKIWSLHGTLFLSTLLAALPLAPRVLAAESRLVDETVHYASLEGNLVGDPTNRSVLVYLPPSYDSVPAARYPVVYLLHGAAADNGIWVGRNLVSDASFGDLNIQATLDRLIADGQVREMILVMPDGNTALQANWYVDTPVVGDYEDAFVHELVQQIDANYRTLAQRQSRGIFGHSMGGYGAIYLAMHYPEVYGAVYGHDATALQFEAFSYWSQPATQGTALYATQDWGAFLASEMWVKMDFADACTFSPNPGNPPFYTDWLWVEEGGELKRDETVWQRWQAFDPTDLIPQLRDNLLQLQIKFDGATEGNIDAARAFDDALTAAGIPHQFEGFTGSHMGETASRMETDILPFFSGSLVFETDVTAVQAVSWGSLKAVRQGRSTQSLDCE